MFVLRCDIVRFCRNFCSTTSVARKPSYAVANHDPDNGIEQDLHEIKEALAKISDNLMSVQTSRNHRCEDVRATDANCKRRFEAETLKLHGLDAFCPASFVEQRKPLQKLAADVKSFIKLIGGSDQQLVV